jgi:ABC-type lipopolysaccharide export system ATPase subunit
MLRSAARCDSTEMNALEIRELSKTYRNGIQALRGIDLTVAEGDFFALLGPKERARARPSASSPRW